MRDRFFLKIFLVAISLLAGLTCAPEQSVETPERRLATQIALDWNRLLLDLERHTEGYRPPVSARMFAYTEMAAYEAAVPNLKGYTTLGKVLEGYQPPAPPDPSHYDLPTALNVAYASILRAFFPTAPKPFLTKINQLEAKYAQVHQKLDPATLQHSADFGRKAAAAVWEYSVSDLVGHNGFLHNYKQDFVPIEGLEHWKPSAEHPTPPLLPKWGEARLFLSKPGEIVAKSPIKHAETRDSDFYTEALEVFSASQVRSKEDIWIAEFWSDDLPGLTLTPAGRWISITNQAFEKSQADFPTVIETYLRASLALCDAGIVCWEGKYRYQLERPDTYIRRVIQPGWQPLHDSPPFPAYPSGHSIFGAAVAEVLTGNLGEHFSMTDRTHKDRPEFAGRPRAYGSFDEMARENAFSRVLLGVHYRMDCEEGLRLGKIIGQKALALPLRRDEAAVVR
jgi:hypothetical protein